MKTWKELMEAAERRYFIRLIDKGGGNIERMAKIADIGRNQVYAKLRKYELNLPGDNDVPNNS